MTDSCLKNKRLLSDELTRCNFDNEIFTYEITDIKTNFTYDNKPINNIDEKLIIYTFIHENENNKELYKTIISNFITLIKYLNISSKDENNKINSNTKISELKKVQGLNNITKEFWGIFQDEQCDNQEYHNKSNQQEKKISNINLNVSKILSIFDYFLMLIFKYVKMDIEKYQEKNKEFNSIYNKLDFNKMDIKKDHLLYALRIFITLVLFRENDKVNKIKTNKKNIIDYLKNNDLWESSLYNNPGKFKLDLSKIKGLNIKIKEILYFYNYLLGKKDEGFENEVLAYKKKIEDEEKERIRLINRLENGNNSDSDDDSQNITKKNESSEESSDIDSDDDKQKKKKKKKSSYDESDNDSDEAK